MLTRNRFWHGVGSAGAAVVLGLGAALPARAWAQVISNAITGGRQDYVVRKGDFLGSISARLGANQSEMLRDNGLDPRRPLPIGRVLHANNTHVIPPAPAARPAVVVNIAQRMLYLFTQGESPQVYPVAVGRPNWATPSGDYRVRSTRRDPTWVVPQSIQDEMRSLGLPVLEQVSPGPDNPLGGYWIGLSLPGYGIHGTNAPSSIYSFRTHGCIRLHSADAAALFNAVEHGTPVRLLYAPLALAVLPGGDVLLEADPDPYRKGPDASSWLRQTASRLHLQGRIDWNRAEHIIARRDGIAHRVDLEPASTPDHAGPEGSSPVDAASAPAASAPAASAPASPPASSPASSPL